MQDKEIVFQIKQGAIAEVVALSKQLPEFDHPHEGEVYEQRLKGVPHLILVAWVANQRVAFKVGYERDGYFYSWMGGVLPAFRRKGIAGSLAETQENWARQHNYPGVTFKTRNRHQAMLLFAIARGFQVIGFEEKSSTAENRILLRKSWS